MVQIIRKGSLPLPSEVPEALREAAAAAFSIQLREQRPEGFPLLFSDDMQLIESAVAFLHEHFVERAYTRDTLRTYAEILYDWFDTLEQNGIDWSDADAADLVAYRNRMLTEESTHTGRAYSVRTINHRVRGVLRFYQWAVRSGWLTSSPLSDRGGDFSVARQARFPYPGRRPDDEDRNLFVLRQFASLPRPLTPAQACDLMATLVPPYDLLARWQLYTGLRVSEILRLSVFDVFKSDAPRPEPYLNHQLVDVVRKGRKPGHVIASASLLEETSGYIAIQRRAWLTRAARKKRTSDHAMLFIGSRGTAISKNRYQQVVAQAGAACGFKATTHALRSTFACMMLARLERQAKLGAAINPLYIVKVLMGHEHIETTDRYLRAVAVDTIVLDDILDSLLTRSP